MSNAREVRSRISKRLKDLETAKKKLEGMQEQQETEQLRVLKRQIVQCEHCRKRSHLGRWSFIQTHWYEAPYSCFGGDQWHRDETKSCHIACPACGAWNYIHNHAQKALIVKTLDGYRIYPSQIFSFVFEHHKNEWPIKQVHPAQP